MSYYRGEYLLRIFFFIFSQPEKPSTVSSFVPQEAPGDFWGAFKHSPALQSNWMELIIPLYIYIYINSPVVCISQVIYEMSESFIVHLKSRLTSSFLGTNLCWKMAQIVTIQFEPLSRCHFLFSIFHKNILRAAIRYCSIWIIS